MLSGFAGKEERTLPGDPNFQQGNPCSFGVRELSADEGENESSERMAAPAVVNVGCGRQDVPVELVWWLGKF